MKNYIYLALKKEKKSISMEKIFSKIEMILSKEKKIEIFLTEQEKEEIRKIISDGVKNYEYYETPEGNYSLITKTSFRKGRFRGDKRGNGCVSVISSYFDREGNQIVKTEKYSVSKEEANGAIDGDLVLIDIGSKKIEPKVDRILERNLDSIIGEVYRNGNSYFVKPVDDKKKDLIIALEGEHIEGQRVAVSLEEQRSNNFYVGKVIRVFNHKDDPDADILWEAFKLGIDDRFSEESLEQVDGICQSVKETDKIGREDLTDWEIFTIDGEDTKDIDDALSCKRLKNGNYLVGVHIADVSHYVGENSPLDRDAFRKGTSNYLAGTVIPMLPHELSNGICSLNPQVERLAMSCIMEVSPDGKVVSHRIVPSVIKSSLKMSYTKVNQILKEGKVSPEYSLHSDTLIMLNKLALILRKNRILAGSVEFDKPELKLIYDDNKKVKDFSVRYQDLGENLIEEFMLLANETVDKHLTDSGLPCLHRVHDIPNEKKLKEFLLFLDAINIPYNNYTVEEIVNSHKALQDLAKHIKSGGKLSNVLSTSLVRCMSKAKYSPNNIGHHGLAKNNYCHFTSPIRRYPDLTVHRIIKDCCLNEKDRDKNKRKWERKLLEIGDHSSAMEKIADEAENETLKLKCCEYMTDHIGDVFEGTIIKITTWGFVVQLDNLVEGEVSLKDLEGDYISSPNTYSVVSLDGKKDYYVGDRLRLRVKSTNKDIKRISFSVIEKVDENFIQSSSTLNQAVKIKGKRDRANREFYGK